MFIGLADQLYNRPYLNMKINLHLLLSFLLLTTILGCDKKQEVAPEFKPKCRLLSSTLTKDIVRWEPFVVQLNYTYDEQGKLIKIATPDLREITALTYDAQNRLVEQLIIFTDPNNGLVQKDKWITSYKGLNQVEKQERKVNFYDFEPSYLGYYSYKYNAAKKRTEAQHYVPDRQTPFYTYKYSYTNGQISQIIEYFEGNETFKLHFSFDGKFSPMPDLPLINYRFTRGAVNPVFALFRQNVTSYILTSPDGSNIYKHESYTATYTYNEHGYPTEAIKTYLNGDKETTVYTYDCGK
ncbi:hypothetical protein [Pontibacter vulgaris]|uniref:hypothetical protein n=1 Tax=Pontibacter vulgaris TaxID=2905679 RepID=UPI001FA70F6E|nr:hypothetical protein [Pontibacter vulgaris]